MIINIDLLDGATLEHEGFFYTSYVRDERLQIHETFTALQVRDSFLEAVVLRAIISGIAAQTDSPI